MLGSVSIALISGIEEEGTHCLKMSSEEEELSFLIIIMHYLARQAGELHDFKIYLLY